MADDQVKDQVRQFYDQVGWQLVGDDAYQNARYEDLRPVSNEYIQRCHLRLLRHLRPTGKFLLDAGSGPVQYPVYLEYSRGYDYRICLDISYIALVEAKKRLQEKGLYVVADVANLPFKRDAVGGFVSLHTLHHLPVNDQPAAFDELFRVLLPGCSGVVVNGWTDSPLMRRTMGLVRGMERISGWSTRLRGRYPTDSGEKKQAASSTSQGKPTGTYVQKLDAKWLRLVLDHKFNFDILVWRSVSVRWLRAVIHPALGGKYGLRFLFWLEERFPHYFGEKGQYPLVVIRK
jgi:ubiquinone/menaquinone biosynthesis C-methylase UbiE